MISSIRFLAIAVAIAATASATIIDDFSDSVAATTVAGNSASSCPGDPPFNAGVPTCLAVGPTAVATPFASARTLWIDWDANLNGTVTSVTSLEVTAGILQNSRNSFTYGDMEAYYVFTVPVALGLVGPLSIQSVGSELGGNVIFYLIDDDGDRAVSLPAALPALGVASSGALALFTNFGALDGNIVAAGFVISDGGVGGGIPFGGLDVALDNFTFTDIPPPGGGEVPEPTTFALMGASLVGLALYRRRQ